MGSSHAMEKEFAATDIDSTLFSLSDLFECILSIKLSIRHSRDMAQCLPLRELEIPWGENTLNDN